MAFIRARRKKNFTIVDNTAIDDPDIPLGALGLLVRMLSFPDDWKFYEKDLVKRSNKDGRDKVHNFIVELQKAGYITKIPKRDSHGRFSSPDWLVSDIPQVKLPSTEKPCTVNPETEKPSPENPHLLKTNGTKDLSNKELINLSSSNSSLKNKKDGEDDEKKNEKQKILRKMLKDAQILDDVFGKHTMPTNSQLKALNVKIKNQSINLLNEVSVDFEAQMRLGTVQKPINYLITLLNNAIKTEKEWKK